MRRPSQLVVRWTRRPRWPGPPGATRRTALLGIVVLACLVTIVVTGMTRLRTDANPWSYLPPGDPTLSTLEDAARDFGADPIVVLAESTQPGDLLSEQQLPRLVALEGKLAKLPDVAVVYGPGTVLNQVARSSQDLVAQLAGTRDALIAQAEQRARAQGDSEPGTRQVVAESVRGFDERYASLLARGLSVGLPTLRNPEFARTVIFDRATGQPHARWRFIVPTPNSIAILIRPRENVDQAGTERLVDAVRALLPDSGLRTQRVTVSGAPVVVAELGARVRQEIPLIGSLAVVLIASCYFFVPWTRRRRVRLLPLTATLSATGLVLAVFGWFGRPLSLGAIAFLPILLGIGGDFPAYLIRGAHRREVLVAALASAVGFASLAISPLPFVRDLGLALAAGVLLAVGIAWLLSRRLGGDPGSAATEDRPVPRPGPWSRPRLAMVGAVVALAGLGWMVLPRLGLEADPAHLADGTPAIEQAHHIEELLGSSGEAQLILRGPNVNQPEALAWLRHAEDLIVREHGGDLQPIISMPDLLAFLGPTPTPNQLAGAVESLPAYLLGAVVSPDQRAAQATFGVRLQDLATQGALLENVRTLLPPPPNGFRAELAGLPVAAAQGYQLLGRDRYLGSLCGVVLAGLVLLVGLTRRRDALCAIAAALLATGWGILVIWLLRISLTPLTAQLGSLTTATACEFTVLLASASRGAPIRRTVTVAALAAALGYLSLVLSGLAMIRQFGVVLAGAVLLSLVAATVVTSTYRRAAASRW